METLRISIAEPSTETVAVEAVGVSVSTVLTAFVIAWMTVCAASIRS
jgi:hypothetical protein